MSSSQPELKVFKDVHGPLATILFLIFVGLMYVLFYSKSLNSPDPSFANLSKAYAYSIVVWIYGMLVIIYAALKAWR